MTYEIQNAKIDYTKLGTACSDHGIQSFIIGLDYDGAGQGFGMLCLDTYDKEKKKRVATTLASSLLLAVDEVWGVDWEKLKGLPCRAYKTRGGVKAIGHFMKDKWLWFNEELLEFTVTGFEEVKEK